jgi:hypothetical protein
MPLSQMKGTSETPNYAVKVVHFTKPESINSPVNVAFEVTDPTTGEGIIQTGEVPSLDLYTWFLGEQSLAQQVGDAHAGHHCHAPKGIG